MIFDSCAYRSVYEEGHSGQTIRMGSGGKAPEVAGTWKEFPTGKFSDSFRRFSTGSCRGVEEIN